MLRVKHWQESAAIFKRLNELLQGGESAALATLVSIEGSSYRRCGARLLFEGSGASLGNVSGGCLEEDLRAHAAKVRASGEARIVCYDTSEDTPWGPGLGCDGRVELLVQIVGPEQADVITELGSRLDGDADFELLVHRDGRLAFEAGEGLLLREAFEPPPRLLICGAGDDALPLCRLAAESGLRVELADPRPAYLSPARFPLARRLHSGGPEDLPHLDAESSVVIMNHHLERDRECLRVCLASPARYIGLLGPRRRREELLAALESEPDHRLHAPAGLDLGGEGAEAIAVAVLAELLAALHGRSARPLRERDRAIHDRT